MLQPLAKGAFTRIFFGFLKHWEFKPSERWSIGYVKKGSSKKKKATGRNPYSQMGKIQKMMNIGDIRGRRFDDKLTSEVGQEVKVSTRKRIIKISTSLKQVRTSLKQVETSQLLSTLFSESIVVLVAPISNTMGSPIRISEDFARRTTVLNRLNFLVKP